MNSGESQTFVEENSIYKVKCESLEVEVVDGEDMYLMSLEMDTTG